MFYLLRTTLIFFFFCLGVSANAGASESDKVTIEIKIEHPSDGIIIKKYNINELNNMKPSGLLDDSSPSALGLKELVCAIDCKPKKGYLACVARCLVDGKACDNGTDNCS